jgi:TctA family transporter
MCKITTKSEFKIRNLKMRKENKKKRRNKKGEKNNKNWALGATHFGLVIGLLPSAGARAPADKWGP